MLAAFVAGAILLAGCAASEAQQDAEATHMPASQIVEDPSRIAGLRYLASGQPDAAALDAAAEAGYTAVVDLRAPDEERGMDEQAEVEARGMRYVTLPIATAEDVSFEAAAEFSSILDGIDGPVLVHCASGNRVGALFALRARAEGASAEESLEIGEAAGLTRLRGHVEKLVNE